MCNIYCPICAKLIEPENREEVEHDGFLYVHDDVFHGDDDIVALENGVQ